MNPEELFADLERKYQLPSGYLARTYQIESAGGRNLYNRQSGAAGPFQFVSKTARAYNLKDPYDLAASAEAAAKLAADNRADLQAAGIENPTASQLYLAHQQGAKGATKLLMSGETPATQVVGKNAVLWNAGQQGMSGPEFAQSIMTKFEGTKPAYSAPTGAVGPSPMAEPRERLAAIGDKTQQAGRNLLGIMSGGMLGDTRVPTNMGIDSSKFSASNEPGFSGPAGAQMQAAAKDYGFKNYAPAAGDPSKMFAGLGSLGMALMAMGAPRQTWTPSAPAPAHRGQWREDIFGGLLG